MPKLTRWDSRARGSIFSDAGTSGAGPVVAPAQPAPLDVCPASATVATSSGATTEAPPAPVAAVGNPATAGGAPAAPPPGDMSGDTLQPSNTVLRQRQWDWLDEQARLLSRRTGQRVRRAELLRLLVESLQTSGLSMAAPADAEGRLSVAVRVSLPERPR